MKSQRVCKVWASFATFHFLTFLHMGALWLLLTCIRGYPCDLINCTTLERLNLICTLILRIAINLYWLDWYGLRLYTWSFVVLDHIKDHLRQLRTSHVPWTCTHFHTTDICQYLRELNIVHTFNKNIWHIWSLRPQIDTVNAIYMDSHNASPPHLYKQEHHTQANNSHVNAPIQRHNDCNQLVR